jgi:hypothetical protein
LPLPFLLLLCPPKFLLLPYLSSTLFNGFRNDGLRHGTELGVAHSSPFLLRFLCPHSFLLLLLFWHGMLDLHRVGICTLTRRFFSCDALGGQNSGWIQSTACRCRLAAGFGS